MASANSAASRLPLIALGIAVILVCMIGITKMNSTAEAHLAQVGKEREQGAQTASQGAADEIALYIDSRWHLVQLLIRAHREDLRELAANPGSDAQRQRVWTAITAYFPEAVNFTIATSEGQVEINDFRALVGPRCVHEIHTFAKSPERLDVLIHSNPDPDDYHFDIIGKIGPQDGDGIIVVSLGMSVLERLLGHAMRDQHKVYLTRKERVDGKTFHNIVLTEDGHHGVLDRNRQLEDDEIASVLASAEVAGTDWEVIDIPEGDSIEAQKSLIFSTINQVSIMLGLIALSMLFLLWQVGRRPS